MKNTIIYLQIAISVMLIISITLQNKSDGVGRAFGTENSSFSTRRGIEKTLYALTGVLIFLFLILSLVNFVV